MANALGVAATLLALVLLVAERGCVRLQRVSPLAVG